MGCAPAAIDRGERAHRDLAVVDDAATCKASMAAAAGEAAAPTSWSRSGPALPTTNTDGGPGPPSSLDVQDVDWDGYLQEVAHVPERVLAGQGPTCPSATTGAI